MSRKHARDLALSAPEHPAATTPTVALVLGGGGARGLAHILMIEALEELGVTPKLIAGTSIGAVFGWAAASGLSARHIRAHSVEVLSGRFDMLQTVLASSAEPIYRLLNLSGRAMLKAERMLDLVMPTGASKQFASLKVPLKIVATDFYAQQPVVFETGPCRDAVAASMALPAVFQPVMNDGRALMDGGLVNPLPFDLVRGFADIIVAIDVTGGPLKAPHRDHPAAMESLFASFNILERTIIQEKLRVSAPDILIAPGLDRFRVLDFHKIGEILEQAMPAKEQLKRALAERLEQPTIALPPPAPAIEKPAGVAGMLSRIEHHTAKRKGHA